jgi:hypothetical protein
VQSKVNFRNFRKRYANQRVERTPSVRRFAGAAQLATRHMARVSTRSGRQTLKAAGS